MRLWHAICALCAVCRVREAIIGLPIGGILATVGRVTETVIFHAHAIMARQAILTDDGDALVAGPGLLLLLSLHQNQAEGDGSTHLDTAGSQGM
jgi:hypothetical protein